MIDLPIETDRLILRQFEESDSDELYAYLSDPDIYRYEPGEPITATESDSLCAERSQASNFIAVHLKSSGKLIGHLTFFHAEPAYVRTCELGFIFNKEYHNQGYCTEAVRALIVSAFKSGQVHRIEARCDVLNLASSRVLEKTGFVREGLMRKQIYFRTDESGQPIWVDAYLYALLSEDIALD